MIYQQLFYPIWLYYYLLINRKPYFLVYLLSNNKLKNFTFQSGYILRNSKPKTLHSILVIFQSGFLLVTIITLFSYIVNENITFIVLQRSILAFLQNKKCKIYTSYFEAPLQIIFICLKKVVYNITYNIIDNLQYFVSIKLDSCYLVKWIKWFCREYKCFTFYFLCYFLSCFF